MAEPVPTPPMNVIVTTEPLATTEPATGDCEATVSLGVPELPGTDSPAAASIAAASSADKPTTSGTVVRLYDWVDVVVLGLEGAVGA